MTDWFIYTIGFLAQILFSSRLIIQWLSSEKRQRSITPISFWTVSLLASFLLFIYGYLRLDFAIMLGQVFTYFIYIRNLQLEKYWLKIPFLFRTMLYVIPVALLIYYFNNNKVDIDLLFKNQNIKLQLLVLGILAHLIFNLRFVYQWLYSEKHKKSILPFGFWLLSVIGSVLILIYGIFRNDPVLIVGHSFGLCIYIRNIYFIKTLNDS